MMYFLLFFIRNFRTSTFRCFIIIGYLYCILCACDNTSKTSALREDYLSHSPDDVVIGIVDSSKFQSHFIKGVKLAIDEINQLGVLGKKIRPVYFDDQASCQNGKAIAKKISKDPKVLAVIGHNVSDIAISTSITYEKNGILFISPGASVSDLIQNQYKYIFRNIPSNEQLTSQLIKYANKNQLKKIVVVFDNQETILAFIFGKFRDKKVCQLTHWSRWCICTI
ncbi:branched-chain amino acid ABC transporter substrate-binding protein [Candidatus Magnetomorum sp. HK-1]|nr:branched-chain amino acid ABC transporter substrate-binding protein [Candidatus Magnetomorum sp. HK-1]